MKIFSLKSCFASIGANMLNGFRVQTCLIATLFLIFAAAAPAQIAPGNNQQTQIQNRVTGDKFEELMRYFVTGVKQVEQKTGISDLEYVQFLRYYINSLDSERAVFGKAIESGKVTLDNADQNQTRVTNEWVARYHRFVEIRKEFPQSVAEYEHRFEAPQIACTPGCNNVNFGQGSLNGWYCYYAQNNSDFAPCNSNCFDLANQTGGLQGNVWKMNPIDPNTSTYQVHCTTNWGNDKINPADPIPPVSPWATAPYSVMIGDSIGFNYGSAIIKQKFKVGPSNANFTYAFAVVLQNPAGHPYYDQPFFMAAILDSNNDTIPRCGAYSFVSGDNLPGWNQFLWGGENCFDRNWTMVSVPLAKYIGQCVTVVFEVADCGYGGHFGYAYIDCSCSPLGVISSSPAFCGQKTINLTAPPGASHYLWSGPPGGIKGYDTTQVITIDSSGTYEVVVTPITGSACNDTLKINVPKLPGPPPIPSFNADTVCVGDSTFFKNTSTNPGSPWTGCKFYWDFYNIGNWNDTVNSNPYWKYLQPGVYKVKLQELASNGCGSDTIISIKVDSGISGSFTPNPATQCVGQPVGFTNNTQGGNSYKWYFDDPKSGPADSSSLQSPSHTYDSAGTYTVTLVAKNSGNCNETVTGVVNILALPKPTITGSDSLCPAAVSGTLTASGGFSSYSWAPGGQNTQTITGLSAGTYTVTVSNGTCNGDTAFTIYTKPNPIPGITASPDSICAGDSSLLTAGGGGTYAWSNPPGGTSPTVKVVAGTYTLAVTKSGCTHDTTITVVPLSNIIPTIGLTANNLCPNDSTTLKATGGTSYKWMPGGSIDSTLKVDPGTTSIYTCTITTPCRVIDTTITVTYKHWPIIGIGGDTSICLGNSGVITATGGGTYNWNNGQTSGSIIVAPAKDSVFSVQVTLNGCSKDTSIQINVHTVPHVTVTPPNKICIGNPFTLTASGACNYLWSNGATTSSITVSPASTTTYTVKAWCYNDTIGCDTILGSQIIVDAAQLHACCDTTIVSGDTASLSSYGSNNYVWTPNFGLSCDNCPNAVATPSVTTTYTVSSIDTLNGCTRDTVITVVVNRPCNNIYAPNVFTPNNDGINDDFVISVDTLTPSGERSSWNNFTFYSIAIFDRWGKEVFSSTDPAQPWNGRVLNTQNLVPDGVYYYVIKTTCGGSNGEKKGFVEVLGEK